MPARHLFSLSLLSLLAFATGFTFNTPHDINAAEAFRDDAQGKDAVEKLMKRVHKGKNSPYKQIEDTLFTKTPDWKLIDEHLPNLVEMAKLLKTSSNMEIQDSSAGYADAVAELAPLVKERSLKPARDKFDALSKACADCHFRGGIGGVLD